VLGQAETIALLSMALRLVLARQGLSLSISMRHHLLAALSGMIGAMAACMGKFSSSEVLAFRLLSIAALFALNSIGGVIFIRSLGSLSSLTANIVAVSVSILATGLLGALVGESLSVDWIIGAMCLICGSALIIKASSGTIKGKKD
jgi:hypothetical protein